MESDAFALRTALFFILAVILSAATWTVFRDTQFEYRPYLVTTEQSVSGLALKARIYYKGVEVGAVEDIFFRNNDFDHVQILIHVDESIPIAQNTYAQLALRGITGEYDLLLNNDGALGPPLPTSVESPAAISMRSEYITKLGEAVEDALANISDTSDRVSQLLNEENQQKASRLLTTVSDAAEHIGTLQRRLTPALDELPRLLSEATRTMQDYQALAASLDSRTQGLETVLAKLSQAAQSLDNLALAMQTQTITTIDQSLESFGETSRALNRALEDIRQDPQRLLLGAPAVPLGPGETTGERPR